MPDAPVRFGNVLKAAGLDSVELLTSGAGWQFWHVEIPNAFAPSKLQILHLMSDATWESAPSIRAFINESKFSRLTCYAVVEPSARVLNDPKKLLEAFSVSQALTPRQFLGKAIKSSILGDIKSTVTEDLGTFIQPKVLTPNGGEFPALQYLRAWVEGTEPAESRLGVLVADAGIGKTTMCRHLRQLILKFTSGEQVPLLIESDHWRKLADVLDLNMWDIWKQSLARQAQGISVEGTFNTCVHEGILLPIFDGFDELCSLRSRQFAVDNTLHALIKLVNDGDGRMLMTTREGYWENNVHSELQKRCTVFRLLPFDQHLRDKFFEERFPKDFDARKRAKAVAQAVESQLYADVTAKYPKPLARPTSIPAVLELIAASVEDENSELLVKEYQARLKADPFDSVLAMLCERERHRQGIKATAIEQLDVFSQLAMDWNQDEFLKEDIEIAASATCAIFDDENQRRLLFAPHPLLVLRENAYSFRFEFLRDFLRSLWLENHWNSPKELEKTAAFFEKNAAGTTPTFEYLAMRLLHGGRHRAWSKTVVTLAKNFRKNHPLALSGLWHLSTILFNKLDGVSTKTDRLEKLLDIFGDSKSRKFTDLILQGRLASLDLTSLTFSNCRFDSCVFYSCDFDSSSHFVDCMFTGDLLFENCKALSSVNLTRPSIVSAEATEAFLAGGIGNKGSILNKDAIQRVFRLALQKFVRGGALHTIDVAFRNRGALGQSLLNDEVWDALMKTGVVIAHTISGLGKDRGLAIAKKHQHEVRQFIDNAIVSGGVLAAIQTICREKGLNWAPSEAAAGRN